MNADRVDLMPQKRSPPDYNVTETLFIEDELCYTGVSARSMALAINWRRVARFSAPAMSNKHKGGGSEVGYGLFADYSV